MVSLVKLVNPNASYDPSIVLHITKRILIQFSVFIPIIAHHAAFALQTGALVVGALAGCRWEWQDCAMQKLCQNTQKVSLCSGK